MRRFILLLLVCLFFVGCASNRYPLRPVPTQETWMQQIETNPTPWLRGADHWFMAGGENATEWANRRAPFVAAMSTMSVKVPNFTNIKSSGNFQVQIYGTPGNNSVNIFGPNDGVRGVIVEVRGNTLCLDQVEDVSPNVSRVIVRIAIHQLNSLMQFGGGPIEGIQLTSPHLALLSRGRGNVYLSGNLNIQRIDNGGPGCINVFGANTPMLRIRASGSGTTNICGNVGIRAILHHGSANINIIGANSPDLRIYADGGGKIGISGPVSLSDVQAKGAVRVYAYPVSRSVMHICVNDRARVGLAGRVGRLVVDAAQEACFEGKYLCAVEAFVRAMDSSHVSVAVARKAFVSAVGDSSVYYYGSSNTLTKFMAGNGMVVPIWGDGIGRCGIPVAEPRVSYKGEG